MKEPSISTRTKIIQLLKIGHKLLYIHFCELSKIRSVTHLREYEYRYVDAIYEHYLIKNLTKQQLIK